MKTLFLLLVALFSLNANATVSCVRSKDTVGISVNNQIRNRDWYLGGDAAFKTCNDELVKNVCFSETQHRDVTYYDGGEDGKAPEKFSFDETFVRNSITKESYTTGIFSHETLTDLFDECNYDRVVKVLKPFGRESNQVKSWNVRE